VAYYFFKFLITSLLVVFISEIAKRSSFLGAVLASLPLTSVLAMIWIYQETREAGKVADMSAGIFWLVLPSLPFFWLFPYLLRLKWNFYGALAASSAVMVGLYFALVYVAGKAGIRI
jgi:hypothetical protein